MSKIKILLVDDDADITMALQAILESRNYEVTTAKDKVTGMDQVKAFKPDLVILDVNMTTRYEGFELNKEIRSNEEFSKMPILMLTGIDVMTVNKQVLDMYRAMRNDPDFAEHTVLKVKGVDNKVSIDYNDEGGDPKWLPIDAFLSKPVEPDMLLKEIESLLANR